jgi:hypothetical protein
MLTDRPEERDTLFKEILLKKTSVRVVEQLARRIAQDKIRKYDKTTEMMEIEKTLSEALGTRVMIEKRPNGGRLLIEFVSPEDLSNLVSTISSQQEAHALEALQMATGVIPEVDTLAESDAETDRIEAEDAAVEMSSSESMGNTTLLEMPANTTYIMAATIMPEVAPVIPASSAMIQRQEPPQDENLYSIKNFSL